MHNATYVSKELNKNFDEALNSIIYSSWRKRDAHVWRTTDTEIGTNARLRLDEGGNKRNMKPGVPSFWMRIFDIRPSIAQRAKFKTNLGLENTNCSRRVQTNSAGVRGNRMNNSRLCITELKLDSLWWQTKIMHSSTFHVNPELSGTRIVLYHLLILIELRPFSLIQNRIWDLIIKILFCLL